MVRTGQIVSTKKTPKKERSNLRITNEDVQRHTAIWSALNELADSYDISAVGVEGYRSYRGTGSSAKTLAVYGGILWWCFTKPLFVAPFLPSDLKRRFCSSQRASKDDVARALCDLVVGLDAVLDGISKGQREHVSDAAGHAYLVLEEVDRARVMLGLDPPGGSNIAKKP